MTNLFFKPGTTTPVYKSKCPVYCNNFTEQPDFFPARIPTPPGDPSGITTSGTLPGEVIFGDTWTGTGTNIMDVFPDPAPTLPTANPYGNLSTDPADICDETAILIDLGVSPVWGFISREPYIRYDQPWFIRICGRAVGGQGGEGIIAGTWKLTHGTSFLNTECAGSGSLAISPEGVNTSKLGARINNSICPERLPAEGEVLPIPILEILADTCYCATLSVDPCNNCYCVTLEQTSPSDDPSYFIGYTNPVTTNFVELNGGSITFEDCDGVTTLTAIDSVGTPTVFNGTSALLFPGLIQSWTPNQRFSVAFTNNSNELLSSVEVGNIYTCGP